jgi:hypothetical protein
MPVVIDNFEHFPHTIEDATPTSDGVMSADDKAKLDGIPLGGGADGLKGAYEAATSVARNVITYSAALGVPTIRDQAVPVLTDLFAIWNLAQDLYFFYADNLGQFGQQGPYDIRASLSGVSNNASVVAGAAAGAKIINTSAATGANTVQNSMVLEFGGSAWDTNNSISRITGARILLQSVSDVNTSQNLLFRLRANDGGAYATVATLSNAGILTLLGGLAGTYTLDGAATIAGTPTATKHISWTGLTSATVAAGWTLVTGGIGFQNSWTDFDGTHQVRYTKTATGLVCLQGSAKNGTSTTTAFTLPAGLRPNQQLTFATWNASSVLSFVEVNTDGQVKLYSSDTARVGLDGFFWLADQ